MHKITKKQAVGDSMPLGGWFKMQKTFSYANLPKPIALITDGKYINIYIDKHINICHFQSVVVKPLCVDVDWNLKLENFMQLQAPGSFMGFVFLLCREVGGA